MSVTHTYADGDASYVISATATDEDGTYAAGNTVAVTVHDVGPTLVISGAADTDEGASYTLNLSASDAGADTITQWTINWGDSIEVVSGNPASVTHTYADGDANYTISALRQPTKTARTLPEIRCLLRFTTLHRRWRSAAPRM